MEPLLVGSVCHGLMQYVTSVACPLWTGSLQTEVGTMMLTEANSVKIVGFFFSVYILSFSDCYFL